MAGNGWRSLRGWMGRHPAAVPLLAASILLIAIAAGPRPAEDAWTGLPSPAAIQTVMAVVMVVLALLGLATLLLVRGGAVREPPTRRKRSVLATIAMVFAFALVLSALDREGDVEREAESSEPVTDRDQDGIDVPAPPGFEVGDGAALVVMLLGAVLIVWLLRQTGVPADDEEAATTGPALDPDRHDRLGPAVARAARHLLDRDDPRDAVLLAYDDLERTLERLDLGRRRTETPGEHLRRALTALSLDGSEQARPLLDLAELYARARYSHHPITVDEQHRAGRALERAHDRLVETR